MAAEANHAPPGTVPRYAGYQGTLAPARSAGECVLTDGTVLAHCVSMSGETRSHGDLLLLCVSVTRYLGLWLLTARGRRS